jgi:hypothetical protein
VVGSAAVDQTGLLPELNSKGGIEPVVDSVLTLLAEAVIVATGASLGEEGDAGGRSLRVPARVVARSSLTMGSP